MALRALTPSGETYCSECGAEAPATGDSCRICGRPFEGVLEAMQCPFCGAILFRNAAECYHCGRRIPAESEETYFKTLMESTYGGPRHAPPSPPGAKAQGGPAAPEETAVWRLSEPLHRMLIRRKKRIEQMDALVGRARRRIQMLEASNNPVEVREREELKRQIAEILVEREDILKIEEGIMEMERIYRNILQLQQAQLREREEALKARVESFRKELERREHEKAEIKEREEDIGRREDEFRTLLERLHEREREMDAQETRLGERLKSIEEKAGRLAATEEGLRRHAQVSSMRGGSSEITIQPGDLEFRDLKLRITELEEQMERVVEEKRQLGEERERLSAFHEDVKGVLKALDELLGKLPEGEVKRFAKSKDFQAYEKVLDKYGL